MAFLECKFFSDVLGLSTAFNVIYPEKVEKQIGLVSNNSIGDVPVLYLLHGASDDHTVWARRTSIERYVANKNLCVVMPNADLSYYTDMKNGRNYFKYICEELPETIKQTFNISNRKSDTFIAGLSMGGYGAFKAALTYPDKYCAAASLSGVVDIVDQINKWDEDRIKILENIFGDMNKIQGSKNDLYTLLDRVPNVKSLKLFQCCGLDDFLYEGNIKFKGIVEKLKLDFHFEDGPGNHEWGYWDTMIQKVIDWLPISKDI
ncbi:MAG: esterase [Planctomycetota bacterium]|nr:MAG: esterase [Planctomycetota bacterium]